MGRIFTHLVIAGGALLLSTSLVLAAPPSVCAGFADKAVANAVLVQQLGGCGLNMNDESLSTNRSVQVRWCMSVLENTVRQRELELWGQTGQCKYCLNYAKVISEAAADNIKYSCGNKNGADQRWNPDYAYHFNGCMAINMCDHQDKTGAWIGSIADFFGMDGDIQCYKYSPERLLDPIVGEVALAMGRCEKVRSSSAPLTSSSFMAAALERMRQRRKQEQAAQARERMLMGGGSRSELVESYSDAKAKARERELMGGSRSEMVEPYTSQKEIPSGGAGGSETPPAVVPSAGGTADGPRAGSAPASGGAGGSEAVVWGAQPAFEWKLGPEPAAVPSGGAGGSEVASAHSQPAAVPNSGGAGGSENTLPNTGIREPARNHAIGTTSPTSQATQQVCLNDPKTVDDAQLKVLLADPQIRARVTSLIAEESGPRKAKTRQNQRGKRVRAPTDADNPVPAGSNSGISPEAANAIGTIIGVGIGVGLNNAGRRGASGAGPHRGTSSAAPRRGTFDGPPR
jgi:hypothetical protein